VEDERLSKVKQREGTEGSERDAVVCQYASFNKKQLTSTTGKALTSIEETNLLRKMT